MPLLYLDTNQAVRVFEREREVLYLPLQEAAVSGAITLVVSDILLLEVVRAVDAGGERGRVREALQSIEALNPRWIALRNLEMDELRSAYTAHAAGRPFAVLNPLTDWPTAAALIAEELGGNVEAWRAARMPELLFDAYEAGGITERLDYWQGELAAHQEAARREWGAAQTLAHATRRVFQSVVEHTTGTFGADEAGARAFAALLWDHPEACPAFRLNLEATVELLWNRRRDWKRNDFLDLKHAGAVAYVDHFVTAEGWMRTVIVDFDRRRRLPARLESYRPRLSRRVEDVPTLGAPVPVRRSRVLRPATLVVAGVAILLFLLGMLMGGRRAK